MRLDLEVQQACEGEGLPDNRELSRWVRAVLEGRREAAELSIRIVDEEESRRLNRDYRRQDKPTNVLSFPADLPDEVESDLLGDLVICAAVVAREAAEQNKVLQAHWAHMVIHGVLHLVGFDHQNTQEAEEMEGLERQMLEGLGYPDPYRETQSESL